jgi:hypothetical protein
MAKLLSDGMEVDGSKLLSFECHRFLWEPITEVDGATVGTLLDILRGDADFFSRLFDAPHLGAYLDEPATTDPEDKRPLRYLDFRWYVEKWNGKHWHKDGGLEFYPDVSGVGLPDCPEIGVPMDEDVHYALDFTPLPSLSALPIIISDKVELIEYDTKNYNEKRSVLGRMDMTLLDVLRTLVEEASFHGSPEDRDGRMSDIKGVMEQVDEDIKNGKIEYKTLDEVKKELGVNEGEGEGEGEVPPKTK